MAPSGLVLATDNDANPVGSHEAGDHAPVYPPPSLTSLNDSANLVEWIVGGLGVDSTPVKVSNQDVGFAAPDFRVLFRNSTAEDWRDPELWGFAGDPITVLYRSNELDVLLYYYQDGVLYGFVVDFAVALPPPNPGNVSDSAGFLSAALGLPEGPNPLCLTVEEVQYGTETLQVAIMSNESDQLPRVNTDLGVFWFNSAGAVLQIQVTSFTDCAAGSLPTADGLMIGRRVANEMLQSGKIDGCSFLESDRISGIRLVALRDQNEISGNHSGPEPTLRMTFAFEYSAMLGGSESTEARELALLIDSEDGSILWTGIQPVPIETGPILPIGNAIFVVLSLVCLAAFMMIWPPSSLRIAWLVSGMVVWTNPESTQDNFNRGRIAGFVVARPGCSYSEIKEFLGISNGTLSYHLMVLERLEFIRSERDGRMRRYYSSSCSIASPRPATIGRTEAMILSALEDGTAKSTVEIAKGLGISRQRASYNLRLLERKGVLRMNGRLWVVAMG